MCVTQASNHSKVIARIAEYHTGMMTLLTMLQQMMAWDFDSTASPMPQAPLSSPTSPAATVDDVNAWSVLLLDLVFLFTVFIVSLYLLDLITEKGSTFWSLFYWCLYRVYTWSIYRSKLIFIMLVISFTEPLLYTCRWSYESCCWWVVIDTAMWHFQMVIWSSQSFGIQLLVI